MNTETKSVEQIDEPSDEYEVHEADGMIKESDKAKEDTKTNDIDYILENIVGDGGWGQWMILICTFPIGMVSGLPIFIQMFAAFEPRHRCFVPNCDDTLHDNEIQTAFIQHALPKEYGSSEMFREDENFDPCNMFEYVGRDNQTAKTCHPQSFLNSSLIKCDQYIYDTSVFEETLTTKFDLVCDEESKQRLLGTLMMLGLLIGSLIGGRLGDRFGRKITMMISQMVLTPVVMFGGYSPNYTIYAILRLISATCLPPMWLCSHSLSLELFGKEYRKSVVMIKDFISPISQLILVLIIYNSRHWTYIHLWTGVACLIPFPCYYFVPESPRWLAVNGKLKQAEKILQTIARRNGKNLNENDRIEIKTTLILIEKDANRMQGQENLNPLDMLRRGHLLKTLILLFNWVTVCVGAYTLMLNATKLYGDLFLNYTLVVLVGDLPGTIALLFTLKFFGRRFNLFYTQFILGNNQEIVIEFIVYAHNSSLI